MLHNINFWLVLGFWLIAIYLILQSKESNPLAQTGFSGTIGTIKAFQGR